MIALVWNRFAPYHHDRCRALADSGAGESVLAVEIAGASTAYPWDTHETPDAPYRHVTIFPGRTVESLGRLERLRALWRVLAGSETVFLCNYERAETAALACLLRLARRRVFVMFDSKFDDKPRHFRREAGKRLMLAPYHGALAAGTRARDYLRFLGVPLERIALGYDTVSMDRLRREAGETDAPHAARPFVVLARFVLKKNLTAALDAYALYRAAAETAGETPRALLLCGDGPERAALAARAPQGVRFTGFLQGPEVARTLAGALALLLPSVEEQWGLVVNEALALGVPVLASTQAGAADGLVRTGVNGYLFDAMEAEGMAEVMLRLARDEADWARLSAGARRTAKAGDAARFAEGVQRLLRGEP